MSLPKIMKKVNTIINFWSNNCDVPYVVYIETLLPELEVALIEYMSFGIMDVWRGFYNPKQAKRGRRKGTTRRKNKKGLSIPDLGDHAGSRLPGAGTMHRRTISDGQHHLWVIYGKIETAFWWIMVISIAFDTVYRWTTALQNLGYCTTSQLKRCLNVKPEVFCIKNDFYEGIGVNDQVYAVPEFFGYTWNVIDEGYGVNIVLGGYSVPDNPLDPPENPRLLIVVDYPGGNRVVHSSGAGRFDHNGTHQVVAVTGFSHKNALLSAIVYKSGGGAAKWNNVTLSIWTTKKVTDAI